MLFSDTKIGSIINIYSNYEKAASDYIPYKESFYSYLSNFEYNYLGSSIKPNKAIVGENGWMFLGSDYGNILNENYGRDTFSAKQLLNIESKIEQTTKKLKNIGVDYFYILIAPNKHTVYSEKMPFRTDVVFNTKLSQVEKLSNSQIINITDKLKSLKNRQFELYHRKNSHWTSFGAFFAYRLTINHLMKYGDPIRYLSISQVEFFKKESVSEDIANMLKLDIKETRIDSRIIKSKNRSRVEKLGNNLNFKGLKNKKYEAVYLNSKCDSKCGESLVLFRDSFGSELVRFFNYSFTNQYVIHSSKIDYEYLSKIKPKYVILEIVERNIDVLLNNL